MEVEYICLYQRMTYVVAKKYENKTKCSLYKVWRHKASNWPPLTLYKIHEKPLGSLKIIYFQPHTES